MIIVYEPTETVFATNGIKIIHPTKAEVYEEDNGDYYVLLEDVSANRAYYEKGMIVRVPTYKGTQGFRCDNPVINGRMLSVKAWHLSYDAENYIIADSYAVEMNCNDALNHFNDATDITSPFTCLSDIVTTLSSRCVRKSLWEAYQWLASEDKYGGHMDRDNWNLNIKGSIGQDRGVTISYGKNLSDIEVSENWDNVVTKVLPYVTWNNQTIMLDNTYVSAHTDAYDIPFTKVIQFETSLERDDYVSDAAYITALKTELQSNAIAYINAHYIPEVNYTVSALIQNISGVGDTIRVKHPRINVDVMTTVIRVVYNAITERYTEVEFGNFRRAELKGMSDTIAKKAEEKTNEIVNEHSSMLRAELEESTARINEVLGASYVIDEGDKILVVDSLPKEQATNCIRISSGGIGFSNQGIAGPYSSAWTIDNVLNMQNINVINLTASMIRGGVLTLGGLNNSSGLIEMYDASQRKICECSKDGIICYASTGDYVKLSGANGFEGYSASGTKTYWADGTTFHMYNAEVENQIKIAGRIKMVPVQTDNSTGIGFVALS